MPFSRGKITYPGRTAQCLNSTSKAMKTSPQVCVPAKAAPSSYGHTSTLCALISHV